MCDFLKFKLWRFPTEKFSKSGHANNVQMQFTIKKETKPHKAPLFPSFNIAVLLPCAHFSGPKPHCAVDCCSRRYRNRFDQCRGSDDCVDDRRPRSRVHRSCRSENDGEVRWRVWGGRRIEGIAPSRTHFWTLYRQVLVDLILKKLLFWVQFCSGTSYTYFKNHF